MCGNLTQQLKRLVNGELLESDIPEWKGSAKETLKSCSSEIKSRHQETHPSKKHRFLPPPFYVYLIKYNGFQKIGITKDLKKRISTFQLPDPENINVLHVDTVYGNWLGERDNRYIAGLIERTTLLASRNFLWYGEWLKTDSEHMNLLNKLKLSLDK